MNLKAYITALHAALFAILLAGSPAGSGSMMLMGVGSPGVAVATTTWNPADKNANITLSNGNLTATLGGAGGAFASLRSVAGHSSGKFYFEVTITTAGNTSSTTLGIGDGSASLTAYCGQNLDGFGVYFTDGETLLNQVNQGTVSPVVQGNVVGVAVDFTAKLIWWRTNAGSWNNNGTANPATGTGGLSSATLNAGPYFAMATQFVTGDVYTANFGATAYANAAPVGFGNM